MGEVLKRKRDEIDVQPFENYKRLTIRLNGKGIVIRDQVVGSQIGTKRQFLVQAGQLVLSKIDARNGAFGVLPQECQGAIITGNFWAFDPASARLDVRYLNYLTMTPLFVDFCVRASEGTTNRRYLQESKFLAQKILLPPLDEQRRIIADRKSVV
jgi:type I restriction enzyme, S subunit